MKKRERFIELSSFSKDMTYKPIEIEEEVLEFWRKKKVYLKQKAMGKKGPKFYWLCGPPYTSGKFHVGHFWNYVSLKDPLFRYKRMQGFDVWDRGGWDMHGLPTSKKVMAKLGIKTNGGVFWGNSGLGKTHLAVAIMKKRLDAGKPCLFVPVSQILDTIIRQDSHEKALTDRI